MDFYPDSDPGEWSQAFDEIIARSKIFYGLGWGLALLAYVYTLPLIVLVMS